MSEPVTEPATPTTEGLAGLLAAAAEQTLAAMSPEAFAELVQRVRPPDEQQPAEPPVQPQGDRPPPRVPVEPTEQQQRDHDQYGAGNPYPASWGFQREGVNS